MSWQGTVLCDGAVRGRALRLEGPISFWGGVCPQTARIIQAGHPQHNFIVTNKILIIPNVIGSSSSSAVMLELLHREIGPSGVIMGQRDAILPIGVLAAQQMGWRAIPMFFLRSPPFKTGENLQLAAGGKIERT